MTPSAREATARLRPFLGLALAGYGLLVLLGLLPHDDPAWAAAALAAGLALLAWGLPRLRAPARLVPVSLGLACVLGIFVYNAAAASGLTVPEIAIAGYGVALLCTAPYLHVRLGRSDVATLVGWSFPVLLAPLAVYALDAGLSAGGPKAASPLVQALVVAPTQASLELSGIPVERMGSTLVVPTPRGSLSLGVGLVCAGLYPMVLFGGVLALHAWRTRPPARQVATWAVAGLAGLWLLNILRLVILARVGIAKGPGTLQSVHGDLGWVLFALFMAGFWAVVLRRARHKAADDPAPATA